MLVLGSSSSKNPIWQPYVVMNQLLISAATKLLMPYADTPKHGFRVFGAVKSISAIRFTTELRTTCLAFFASPVRMQASRAGIGGSGCDDADQTTSNPLPPVACKSYWTLGAFLESYIQLGGILYLSTRCACFRSDPAVAEMVAPANYATCMAATSSPPAADWIKTFSPA